MKKLFRAMLCAALLTVAVSIPAFAADRQAPQQQGDFSVLVNGEYVTFPDATPKIRDSRSCLPFVAVFEQLGFAEKDMTWDASTSTITATKGDTTIALTIGKAQITLTKAGQSTTIDADVAPYIDSAANRTYVPFGLVADALGYKVGWDAQQKTVIIDDVDSILAANTATYTVMDKYMAYSKSFYEKNQNVTGSYAMNLATTGSQDTAFAFDMDGSYKMLTSGATAFQFETDMTMNMTASEQVLSPEDKAMFPMAIDFDMRGDMSNGIFYFQSGAMAKLMGQPDLANAWYKLDLASMFDQMENVMGMNYASLMKLSLNSMNMSFKDSLNSMLRVMPLTSVDLTTADYLAQLNTLLADSSFQTSGSTYVSTLNQDGMVMKFTLYTSNSKVTGYAVQMTGNDPTYGAVEMTAAMKDNKLNVSMTMNMAIPVETGSASSMTLKLTMDGTYKATTEQPATQPPADASIIDLSQMMSSAASEL
ncbi:MAG: copper amine oxidase N-terminal domain-containing protein [Lawsonibacter sp.]|nr:copper amine oxidase N-terminal domain-containing protein [Lawsonibacter sp.]